MTTAKKALAILAWLILLGTTRRVWAQGGPYPSRPIGAVHISNAAPIADLPASQTVLEGLTSSVDFTAQVVELINQARWENGRLPPLKRQEDLDAAAAYHSQDMAVDDYFNHDSYNRVDGQLVFEKAWYERVSSYYSDWSALGECIAAGYTSPQSVVNAWLNSPGHRAILLGENYTEIGSGYYSGAGTYGTYWTTDFGSRPGVYPLVINREAAATDQRDVSLYVYGAGWATQMRFRNETGEWSEWEPYNPDRAWTLSCGNGQKTVYAELSNGSEIRSASDSILLDGEPYRLTVEPDGEVIFLYDAESGQLVPTSAWTLQVENGGTGCGGITWEAYWDENWLTVSPATGTTPSTLTVTPIPPATPGEYVGEVTITALLPADAGAVSQSISVRLIVASQVDQTFLPLVVKGQ
ncbi:MAG TPA: hypothetical protein G4O00_14845 [Thermoflexia bacterium]|jgi:uncharacterized protein YkwD|nr:hypothetical protein [Thermoflexia bacterium]